MGKENRVADLKAYGGFGAEVSSVGAWTAEKSSTWLCLMTIARLCNYTYRFKFSEDWQRADIEIRGNLCCVTEAPCCCKPWFSIPNSCVKFEMVQAYRQKIALGDHIGFETLRIGRVDQ